MFIVRKAFSVDDIIYYRDTRGLIGYGDFSDYFASSHKIDYATYYTRKEHAEEWNKEFLDGDGEVVEVG